MDGCVRRVGDARAPAPRLTPAALAKRNFDAVALQDTRETPARGGHLTNVFVLDKPARQLVGQGKLAGLKRRNQGDERDFISAEAGTIGLMVAEDAARAPGNFAQQANRRGQRVEMVVRHHVAEIAHDRLEMPVPVVTDRQRPAPHGADKQNLSAGKVMHALRIDVGIGGVR